MNTEDIPGKEKIIERGKAGQKKRFSKYTYCNDDLRMSSFCYDPWAGADRTVCQGLFRTGL